MKDINEIFNDDQQQHPSKAIRVVLPSEETEDSVSRISASVEAIEGILDSICYVPSMASDYTTIMMMLFRRKMISALAQGAQIFLCASKDEVGEVKYAEEALKLMDSKKSAEHLAKANMKTMSEALDSLSGNGTPLCIEGPRSFIFTLETCLTSPDGKCEKFNVFNIMVSAMVYLGDKVTQEEYQRIQAIANANGCEFSPLDAADDILWLMDILKNPDNSWSGLENCMTMNDIESDLAIDMYAQLLEEQQESESDG